MLNKKGGKMENYDITLEDLDIFLDFTSEE